MLSRLFCLLFTGFLLVMTIQFPDRCADAVQSGLTLCLTRAIPSLFPFFVVSALTVRSGLADALAHLLAPLMRLYRLPGAGVSALLLSFLGGYPSGAQTVSELLDSESITLDDAQRLIVFCNNTGPAFLIGFCGQGVFHSLSVGLYLYIIHVLSACLCGLFVRGKSSASAAPVTHSMPPFSACLTTAVLQAGRTMLSVCSFVLTFSVLIALLTPLPLWHFLVQRLTALLPLSAVTVQALLSGFLELTTGLSSLSASPDSLPIRLLLCSILCAFGGVSVLFQSAAAAPRLPFPRILLGKTLHAVLAAILTLFLLPIGPF